MPWCPAQHILPVIFGYIIISQNYENKISLLSLWKECPTCPYCPQNHQKGVFLHSFLSGCIYQTHFNIWWVWIDTLCINVWNCSCEVMFLSHSGSFPIHMLSLPLCRYCSTCINTLTTIRVLEALLLYILLPVNVIISHIWHIPLYAVFPFFKCKVRMKWQKE